MKIKPHGAFFLIPVTLLTLGVILGVVFFYQGVLAPFQNLQEMPINTPIEVELGDGSFVSLFLEDEDMTDYSIEFFDTYYLVSYTTAHEDHQFQVMIENTSSITASEGWNFEEFDQNDAYTYDGYINFADVNMTSNGTYEITISSYDDIPANFSYAVADFETTGMQVVYAVVSFLVGVIGAIIGFIIIIIMRSSSRKKILSMQHSTPTQEPYQPNNNYNDF